MPLTMFRSAVTALSIGLAVGCGGSKPEAATPKPDPERHPLAGLLGQNIIIAPVQGMRFAPELEWAWPPRAAFLARIDSAVADSVRYRVGNQQWVFADALTKAAATNPTYATDPRALAVTPLRSAGLKVEDRLLEPLASQLRTMIALQDARLVLIPVELRVDRSSAGLARPTVRLVLVDPRRSVVRWIGEIRGADFPTLTPAFPALMAAHFADLFVEK